MEIAIVTFDAGVGLYQETSLFFRRALESDHRVTGLGCNRGLSRCTNFLSFGRKLDDAWLGANRRVVCARCQAGQREIAQPGGQFLDLAHDDLDEAQRRLVGSFAGCETLEAARVLELAYDGAPLGRLAFFDYSMSNKVSDSSRLSAAQVEDLLEHLRDAFRIWNFVSRVLREQRFDAALYVNGNYSPNAVARERLRRTGVACWSVEYTWANTAREKRVYLERDRLEHRRDWPAMAALRDTYRCNLRDSLAAIDGMRTRIRGVDFNSYSCPVRTRGWDVLDDFARRFREVVAVFPSSGDELRVHEVVYGFKQDTRFFQDQVEWLLFLVENASPAVGYVIRLHPRLKPNKRDLIQAAEYDRLAKALDLARQRPNILIIEADDTISSYYVLLRSVLSVVSWSMLALESVFLGIPTVACFPSNMSFPIERMGPQVSSREEIRRVIRREDVPRRTTEHDLETLRWVGIVYRGIGFGIPGVRFVRSRLGRAWSRIERLLIAKRWLFRLCHAARYRDRIRVLPDGQIRLAAESNMPASDESSACMGELQAFRSEVRALFRAGGGEGV